MPQEVIMPDSDLDLNKQTIVVTGGSRGIGRSICLSFAKPGANIYFNYFPEDPEAEITKNLITEAGARATGICTSVTSESELNTFFKQILDETGRIDVLINNAGITRDGLLVRMKEADWDMVMDINLKGAFLCTKIAAKVMMKQRYGRIINIASVVGAMGNPGQSNYVASKAGIIGLTKSTALELASRNITVNAVAPGFIDTDMTAALSEKAKYAMLSRIPLGRAGQPDDVASAVSFLASEQAAYITGQVIHVSGGMYT
jgi:3-oxoacyl-[acyl-carrier protein] reductase